jgi:hypothetical protein
LLFETRNIISNLVIDHTDALWVDAKRQVIQQWTEKTREHLPNLWLLARVEHPRQSRRIVGDVEDYKMEIVCDGRCPNNMESGAIVDYHHHKFECIDQHEHAVIAVAPELGACWTTSSGKWMCHQNPKVIKNPPAPSNKLSPIAIAKGSQEIKWAIGISHSMPESGLSLSWKNSIS